MTSLRERLEGRSPRALVTLGSGLGALAERVADAATIGFGDVGLPAPTVPGHAGRFVVGALNGVDVVVQQGRLHLYEGVPVTDVAAAVRAASEAGVDTYIVTNAAGGLRDDMEPGDVLAISDHLNLTGTSPLIAQGEAPQFLDLVAAYDAQLRGEASRAADRHGVRLHHGVYAGLVGPAYETPAEIRMLRTLGADAVGMSTVIEVIAARACGMRVAGFSLITNVHRPGGTSTRHEDVLAAAASGGPRLGELLWDLLPSL